MKPQHDGKESQSLQSGSLPKTLCSMNSFAVAIVTRFPGRRLLVPVPGVAAMVRVSVSVGAIWGATLGTAGCALLAQVALARVLSPRDCGVFVGAFAGVTLLAPAATFGINQLWLQLFGHEGPRATRWLKPSLHLVTLSCMSVIGTSVAWAFMGQNREACIITILLQPVIAASLVMDLMGSVLQIQRRDVLYAASQFLPHAIRLAGIVWVFVTLQHVTIQDVAILYAVVAVVTASSGIVWLRGAVSRGTVTHMATPPGHEAIVCDHPCLREVWQIAAPFGIAVLLYSVYSRSGIVMVEAMAGPESAASYNIALCVANAAYMLPTTLFARYLQPRMHSWFQYDFVRFRRVIVYGALAMVMIGTLVGALLAYFAPSIVTGLFGQAYGQAVLPLRIMCIAIPLHFISTVLAVALVTQSHAIMRTRAIAIMTIGNLLVNALLVPRAGAPGAACSVVIAELLLVVVMTGCLDSRLLPSVPNIGSFHSMKESYRGISR